MAAEIHVGDVGTAFRVTFQDEWGEVLDVSTADALKIWFQRPGAVKGTTETVEFDLELETDGTDGRAEYVTEPGDLVPGGTWRVQGVAYFDGEPVHSNVVLFKVFSNLRDDD